MDDLPANFFRNALRIATGGAGPTQFRQIRCRRFACGHNLIRVFVAQLIKRERAAFRDLDRSSQRGRKVAEQVVHVFRRLDESFTVGEETESRVLNRTAVANASEHILERLPVLIVIVDLIGGKHRNAVSTADGFGVVQHHSVQGSKDARRRDGQSSTEGIPQCRCRGVDRGWIGFADLWINGPANQRR